MNVNDEPKRVFACFKLLNQFTDEVCDLYLSSHRKPLSANKVSENEVHWTD